MSSITYHAYENNECLLTSEIVNRAKRFLFGNLTINEFFVERAYRFWGKYTRDFDGGDDDYIFSLKACLRKLKINMVVC